MTDSRSTPKSPGLLRRLAASGQGRAALRRVGVTGQALRMCGQALRGA